MQEGSYLAQEGTLLLLTGHQISPPEPQLPHQPLQVTDVHVAGFSHPGSRRARAGQGLTLGREGARVRPCSHNPGRGPGGERERRPPWEREPQVSGMPGRAGDRPCVHAPHSGLLLRAHPRRPRQPRQGSPPPVPRPHPGCWPGLGPGHTHPAPTSHTGISSPSRTRLWASSCSSRGPRARSQARASSSWRLPWEPLSGSCASAWLG